MKENNNKKKQPKYTNIQRLFITMFNVLTNDAPFEFKYKGDSILWDYVDGCWCVRKDNEMRYSYIEKIQFNFKKEKGETVTKFSILDISNIKDIETLVKTFSEFNYSKKYVEFYTSYKVSNSNILDNIEKEYLENIITPFKDKVRGIKKCYFYDNREMEYISIILDSRVDSDIDLPHFKYNTMYRHMETNKEYSLKELGLLDANNNRGSSSSRRDLEKKIIALQLDIQKLKNDLSCKGCRYHSYNLW